MFRAALFFPLLLLASCNPCCLAQISLSSNQVQVVSGLDNPRIVGGVVMFDGPSKPSIQPAALVETQPPEKAVAVAALQIPTFEPGVINKVGDNSWLLVGTGSYLVIASGPSELKYLKVELGPTPAPPIPPEPAPKPPDPGPSPDLSPVAKASREAMQAFVQSMAGNMDQLAEGAKAGQFKTVRDAGAKAHEMSLVSQKAFESAMDAILQPKLGGGDLPADAAQVFLDVSTGFKGVK